MTNASWFFVLTLVSLCLLVWTYKVTKKPIVFLYWLFLVGLANIFEFVIFFLFDSYSYSPELFDDPFVDSYLGAITSQSISVPIALTYVAVRNKGLFTILLFLLFFSGVERFFIQLGIYTQNWWTISYTVFFLFLSFLLSEIWYKKLTKDKATWIKWTTIFFCLIGVHIHLIYVFSSILKWYQFTIPLFEFTSRSNLTLGFLYVMVSSVIFTVSAFSRQISIIVPVLTLLIFHAILITTSVLSSEQWVLGGFIILIQLCIISWSAKKFYYFFYMREMF